MDVCRPLPQLPLLGAPVITSDFDGHRTRKPPSNAPGVDVMYRRLDPGLAAPPTFSKRFTVPPNVPALTWAPGFVERVARDSRGGIVEVSHPLVDDLNREFIARVFEGGNVPIFPIRSIYRHLAGENVTRGDQLGPGARVGTVGVDLSQGSAGVRHLHWELLVGGERVDPQPLFDLLPSLDLSPLPGSGGVLDIGEALAAAAADWPLLGIPVLPIREAIEAGRRLARKLPRPRVPRGGGLGLLALLLLAAFALGSRR